MKQGKPSVIKMKLFEKKDSIEQKISSIHDELEKFLNQKYKVAWKVDWFGAYDVDPKHLAFWICTKTDTEKSAVESDVSIREYLNELFIRYNYPIDARREVFLGVESQETVDRDSGGDWYLHFK